MKAYAVGSIVESICGKYNDVMGHTIMAMVGNEIIKVECRVCKSQHRYRPPVRTGGGGTLTMKKGRDGAPVSSRQTTASGTSRPAVPKARKASAAEVAAVAAQEAWREMIRKHDGETPRPYAMTGTFSAGEFISHPAFGLGEVRAVVSPDKIDVLFEAGIKRLLCNKE